MGIPVKVKCRNCGGLAPADQFKLHYSLKMMVCPNCFSGRKEPAGQVVKKEEQPKPAGWDKEDEYLEKCARLKQKDTVQFRRIPETDLVQCTCNYCKYVFKYNLVKQTPQNCPFCGAGVPKVRV